jgi:hypothetical protein
VDSIGGLDKVRNVTDEAYCIGSKLSLFALLLKRRTLTSQTFSKRQLDEALEKLPQRTGAFQSITNIRPLSQIAEALEYLVQTSDYNDALDVLLDFIDESFSRFLQRPYSFFDEAASLIKQDRQRRPFSCVLSSFARQWQYIVNNEKETEKRTVITEFFCDLLFRSAIIGESPDALVTLLESLKAHAASVENVTHLRQRILNFTAPDTVGDNSKSRTLPGTVYLLISLELTRTESGRRYTTSHCPIY